MRSDQPLKHLNIPVTTTCVAASHGLTSRLTSRDYSDVLAWKTDLEVGRCTCCYIKTSLLIHHAQREGRKATIQWLCRALMQGVDAITGSFYGIAREGLDSRHAGGPGKLAMSADDACEKQGAEVCRVCVWRIFIARILDGELGYPLEHAHQRHTPCEGGHPTQSFPS